MPFPPVLEELCPSYIGEERIKLSFDPPPIPPIPPLPSPVPEGVTPESWFEYWTRVYALQYGATRDAGVPTVGKPVRVFVDYTACRPEGLVLPLELLIQAPSSGNCSRRFLRTLVPYDIIFTPHEGGVHGVMLREVAHNRWWGAIRIDVAGEKTVGPRLGVRS